MAVNATVGATTEILPNGGYKGNAVSAYIKTNVVAGASSKMQKDSSIIGVYAIKQNIASQYTAGAYKTGTGEARFVITGGATGGHYNVQNDTTVAIKDVLEYNGFLIGVRQNGTTRKIFKNSLTLTETVNSVNQVLLAPYILALNVNNGAGTGFSDAIVGLYFSGSGLTDEKISLLREAYFRYLSNVGAISYNSIVAFGDSIPGGQGTTVPGTKRFPYLLSSALSKVENTYSHGGATVQPGIRAVVPVNDLDHTKLRFFDRHSKVILYAGTNDLNSHQVAGTGSKSNFIIEYGKLIDKAIEYGYNLANIYICNLFYSSAYTAEVMEDWNTCFPTIAAAKGVTLVDVYTPSKGHNEYLSADTIHPNDAGHVVIKDAILAAGF